VKEHRRGRRPVLVRACMALGLMAGLSFALTQAATPSASAASSGYSYTAGLVTSTGQTFIMGHLTSVALHANQAAVDATLDPDQLSAATTALGAPPTAGFTITKTFDQTDRANFIVGLAGTKVHNAGLFVYNNGTLADHLRAEPAYIAYVDQTAPPAGSNAAATDTIEFVTTQLTRVGTAKVPAATSAPPGGGSYTGELTTSNQTINSFTEITGISVETEPSEYLFNDPGMEKTVQHTIQYSSTKPPVAISITRGWDPTDNALWLGSMTSATQPKLQVTFLKNGSPYLRYTMSSVLAASYDVTYPKPGSTAPPKVTDTFISTRPDLQFTPLG
jgi:hypothetical protein